MKNYISIIYFVAAGLIINSCTNVKRDIPSDAIINVDTLAVNPFQYSSYFKQVDYIPMEASQKSLIGYVHNINCYNDIFFVLDIVTAKRLFIFNLDGKFINAIGDSGKGKGEFYKIIDFSIEPKAEEIYILDQIGKINVFNFDGKFLREINVLGPTPYMYNNLEIVGNSIFLDVKYPLSYSAEKSYLLREVTLEGKFKKDWLDMEIVNKGAGKSENSNILKSLYVTPDGVFYTKEFMDVIYKLEENNVSVFKAVESQFKIRNKDVANMNSTQNFYSQAGSLNKIFSLSNVTTGVNFSYFSYKKGGAPFSVVEKNGSTTLHQIWIDDVSFSGKSFQTQPPHFFATSQDGKTLIGLTNGKNNWQRNIEISNQHIGGIDSTIRDSFAQKFKNVDNPILILYHLK